MAGRHPIEQERKSKKESERMFEVWAPYSLLPGTGGITPGGMAPLPSPQCRARRARRPPCRSCMASSPAMPAACKRLTTAAHWITRRY